MVTCQSSELDWEVTVEWPAPPEAEVGSAAEAGVPHCGLKWAKTGQNF